MVYEPLVREGYEWINTLDPADYEIFLSFDGSLRAAHWKPVKVRRVRADDSQSFKPSDFPWLGSHALVLRESAVAALRSLIEPHGEILPLSAEDGPALYVLNITTIINDALDEERSLILRFPTTNRIMKVSRPYFREPKIRGVDLFRLPHRASPTYISKRFVEVTKEKDLVGLEFKVAWPNEPAA